MTLFGKVVENSPPGIAEAGKMCYFNKTHKRVRQGNELRCTTEKILLVFRQTRHRGGNCRLSGAAQSDGNSRRFPKFPVCLASAGAGGLSFSYAGVHLALVPAHPHSPCTAGQIRGAFADHAGVFLFAGDSRRRDRRGCGEDGSAYPTVAGRGENGRRIHHPDGPHCRNDCALHARSDSARAGGTAAHADRCPGAESY